MAMGYKILCLVLFFATSALADNAKEERQPSSPPVGPAHAMNCCEENYAAQDCATDAHAPETFSCFCREKLAISGNPEVKSYHCNSSARAAAK